MLKTGLGFSLIICSMTCLSLKAGTSLGAIYYLPGTGYFGLGTVLGGTGPLFMIVRTFSHDTPFKLSVPLSVTRRMILTEN